MAKVNQRTWKIPGRRTKRKAWGFTAVVKGKRQRYQNIGWSKEQAQEALAKVLLQVDAPTAEASGITFGEAATKYLGTRTNRGNPRSAGERRQLEHLKLAFGADTLLSQITAAKVSDYKASRFGSVSPHTGRTLKVASVNRPLSILRHLMQLATRSGKSCPPSRGSDRRRRTKGGSGGSNLTRRLGCSMRVPSL